MSGIVSDRRRIGCDEHGHPLVGDVRAGDEVSAWVVRAPRGARYARCVEFHAEDGRTIVASLTQWALVDRETGKLARVPVEVAAPFLSDDTAQKDIG